MIIVAGPTASGKSDLALALARRLGGEVVSADSRQVYRGLDAGTAKPRRAGDGACDGVPYHLIDCAELSETFDAARFALLAGPLCRDIALRGKVPIVAGGTGLYLRALLEGLNELPGRDPVIRRRLEEEAAASGLAALHQRLAAVDPEAADSIPAGNRQRLLRALEVHALTGRPISAHWKEPRKGGWQGPVHVLILQWSSDELKGRIERRALSMWPSMLSELKDLAPRLGGAQQALQSLGYGEAMACLRGELSSEEGLRRLIASTNAYAKRQRTWLRTQLSGTPISGGTPDAMLTRALSALPYETAAA